MVLLIRNPIPRMWQFSDNPDEILTVKLFIQQPYYDSRLYECVYFVSPDFWVNLAKICSKAKDQMIFFTTRVSVRSGAGDWDDRLCVLIISE